MSPIAIGFVGTRLSWRTQSTFTFPHHFMRKSNTYVVEAMIHQSPEAKALFLTDCQYGPEHPRLVQLNSVGEFSLLNDDQKLRLNTLYQISE